MTEWIKKKEKPTTWIKKKEKPKKESTWITKKKDPEGLKDAKKIKGKPHSSPEGRFFSKLRSSPLEIKFNKGGRIGFAHGSKRPKGGWTA